MTLEWMRTQIWDATGKDTTLDPSTDTSYESGPTLTFVCNEAQRAIAFWRDNRTGRQLRLRNLYSELYFKSKLINGTLAPSGTVATARSIKLSTTHVGDQDDRYNGWVISCGTDRRVLMDWDGSGVSSPVHKSWTTTPSNSATYYMFKNFYHFLPSTDNWASSPSGEHIALPSTLNRYKPYGNYIEPLEVEDLEEGNRLDKSTRGDFHLANMTAVGSPSEWYMDGTKLTLNTNTNEERWFKLRYYRSPTDMSADADEPEIPKIFHHGIVLWGIEYVLRRNEEQSKKYALKQDFDSFMRSRINAYMVADDLDSPGVVMRNDYRTGVM